MNLLHFIIFVIKLNFNMKIITNSKKKMKVKIIADKDSKI